MGSNDEMVFSSISDVLLSKKRDDLLLSVEMEFNSVEAIELRSAVMELFDTLAEAKMGKVKLFDFNIYLFLCKYKVTVYGMKINTLLTFMPILIAAVLS